MPEEICFIHNWFDANLDEVLRFIDDFGYGTQKVGADDQELIPVRCSVNHVDWIYITGKGTDEEKKERLISYIEFDQDAEHNTPTDLKITCSDNKFLINYLTKLAIGLWQNFSPREPMPLGHPPDKPYFRSYIDYLLSQIQADVSQRKKDPSDWRKRRIMLFKEIKDKDPSLTKKNLADRATEVAKERIREEIEQKHPTMRQNQVENEVIKQFKERYSHGKNTFDKEDVSNDYRLMKLDWDNSRAIT
jgi:hypothetical protein